jgi:hypothetical protein
LSAARHWQDEKALARQLPVDEASTLPAYARCDVERGPAEEADLLVLVDHRTGRAVRRT